MTSDRMSSFKSCKTFVESVECCVPVSLTRRMIHAHAQPSFRRLNDYGKSQGYFKLADVIDVASNL